MAFRVLEALLLVSALSLDAFAASFAFGVEKIRVPFSSAVVISVVCSAMLTISLFFGSFVKPWLPPGTAAAIGFLILFSLGLTRLFDSAIKRAIRKSCSHMADFQFKLLNFHFLLRIYADSTEADVNKSKTLSATEASSLAIALSLDGLATGFGAGITEAGYIEVVFFSLLVGLLAVILGCRLGGRLSQKSSLDLTWFGGLMLIFLAVMKILPS